jgi:hypothetical protein
MANEQFSRTHFVIRPEGGLDAAAVRAALGESAHVEPLDSPRGGCVVIVPDAVDPEATCADLRARLGHRAEVMPAIVCSDADSDTDSTRPGLRYPTGLLSVRFKSPVSDTELAALAQNERIDLVARAKFSRTQAIFRPRKSDATFLPVIASRIGRHSGIEAVWLDTESSYRKATD